MAALPSDSARADRDLDALLELSGALTHTIDFPGTLYRIACRLAASLGSDRCSILVLDEDRAIVVADSGDADVHPLELALTDYPEIRETVRKCSPLIVDDVRGHALFDEVRARIEDKPLGSTILFPMVMNAEVLSVLHLRTRGRRMEPLAPHELRFGRIVANATAIALRNARLLESIRDRSLRVMNQRKQAERRLRQIEKYQRFFDLAGDGLIIIDGRGQILFANQAAQRLTGLDNAAICTVALQDLVDDSGRGQLDDLMQQVITGTHQRTWEVPIMKASGQVALFSLTAASLDPTEPAEAPAADARSPRSVNGIVSMRDVTETRAMEEELRRTNHFLMNIITSSADAIVVADMEGNVLIFNEVASQITGFTEAEAKARNVDELYPPHTARRLMRALRAPHHGGVGKLEERRETLMTREGDEVPINLAAAIVYDHGTEIATVGIFSDLRERLRMEARLQNAQKATAAVETAGAAAHELNQPLTAIIGAVELLSRKVPETSPARSYLDLILSESERMAQIVAQLGTITQYRTKPYLGEVEILDLDAATKEGDQ